METSWCKDRGVGSPRRLALAPSLSRATRSMANPSRVGIVRLTALELPPRIALVCIANVVYCKTVTFSVVIDFNRSDLELMDYYLAVAGMVRVDLA